MTRTGCWIWNLSVCMTEVAPFCHLAGDKVIWIYSAEFNSLLNETCIFFLPSENAFVLRILHSTYLSVSAAFVSFFICLSIFNTESQPIFDTWTGEPWFFSINKMYEWPVVFIFHSLLFCFCASDGNVFYLHFCNPPKHPPSRKRDEHTWWQISAHSAVLLLLLLLFRLLMSDAGRDFFSSSPDIQIWAEKNEGFRKMASRKWNLQIKILIYLSTYISMMIYGPIIWLAPIVDLSH